MLTILEGGFDDVTAVLALPEPCRRHRSDVMEREKTHPAAERVVVVGAPLDENSSFLRKGFHIIALGDEVRRAFAALRLRLPAGTQLTVINDLPRSVVGRAVGRKGEPS